VLAVTSKEDIMNYIYAALISFVAGIIVGALIYRNNIKKAEAAASAIQEKLDAANAVIEAAKKV
jgi:uncharacterized membrane-anchored protein YhcB (DUF1043 family)